MTKIGYISIAGKPYHAGHHCLVELASNECDLVKLFISTGDRSREGEHFIKGSTMQEIWIKYILNCIPKNVDVLFVSSPVRAIYENIGEANEDQNSNDLHLIYGDDIDTNKNYSEKNLKKYFPYLTQCSKIELKPVSRNITINISGTMMRKFIQLGLSDDFINGLPEPIKKFGNEIWKMLGGN